MLQSTYKKIELTAGWLFIACTAGVVSCSILTDYQLNGLEKRYKSVSEYRVVQNSLKNLEAKKRTIRRGLDFPDVAKGSALEKLLEEKQKTIQMYDSAIDEAKYILMEKENGNTFKEYQKKKDEIYSENNLPMVSLAITGILAGITGIYAIKKQKSK